MTREEREDLHRRMDARKLDAEVWDLLKPWILAATAALLLMGIAWAFWSSAGGAL